MSERCSIQTFEPGEHIVHECDSGSSMYIIKSGKVSVTQSCCTDSVVNSLGPSHVELSRLGQQQFFGEMSLLTGARRAATVTALTSVECVELPKEAVFRVMVAAPQIALNIAQSVYQRQRGLSASESRRHKAGDALALADDIKKHFQTQKIINLIRDIPMLEGLIDNHELLRAIASRAELLCFGSEELIVEEGTYDETGSMYLIEALLDVTQVEPRAIALPHLAAHVVLR